MTSADPTNSQAYLQDLNNISGAYIGNSLVGNINGHGITGGKSVMPLALTYGFPGHPAVPIGDVPLSVRLSPLSFNSDNTTDYNSFLQNFYTRVLNYPGGGPIANLLTPGQLDPSNSESALYGFYNVFTYLLGYTNEAPFNKDLTLFEQQIFDIPSIPNPALAAQFKALFSDFIKNFPFKLLSSDGTPHTEIVNGITYTISGLYNYDNFFKAFLGYLSTSSVVFDASKGILTNNVLTSVLETINDTGTSYLQSYQAIYESFNGPVGTLSSDSSNWTIPQQLFVSRLREFYSSELAKTGTTANPGGFFHTSQDLGSWYNFTQNLYYNPQFNPNSLVNDPKSTLILDEVLRSLISMIGTIQTVAAAQADSLNFLSRWQQAYTNKLNQMHTFALGDGSSIGTFVGSTPSNPVGNDGWNRDSAAAMRKDLNQVNTNYITKLQSNQQAISDNAKSLQSNVNQSNDAANQQGSLADSVLQELSTILSSIFR